jgi:hypothetical protein
MKAEQEATPALKQEVVTSFDGDEWSKGLVSSKIAG